MYIILRMRTIPPITVMRAKSTAVCNDHFVICSYVPSAQLARYLPLFEKLMSLIIPVCPLSVLVNQAWAGYSNTCLLRFLFSGMRRPLWTEWEYLGGSCGIGIKPKGAAAGLQNSCCGAKQAQIYQKINILNKNKYFDATFNITMIKNLIRRLFLARAYLAWVLKEKKLSTIFSRIWLWIKNMIKNICADLRTIRCITMYHTITHLSLRILELAKNFTWKFYCETQHVTNDWTAFLQVRPVFAISVHITVSSLLFF